MQTQISKSAPVVSPENVDDIADRILSQLDFSKDIPIDEPKFTAPISVAEPVNKQSTKLEVSSPQGSVMNMTWNCIWYTKEGGLAGNIGRQAPYNLHKVGEPAVIWADGVIEWWENGALINVDGLDHSRITDGVNVPSSTIDGPYVKMECKRLSNKQKC